MAKGFCQFVQMVLHHWTRWPPCPYMVKNTQKSFPEPTKIWGWILLVSIGESWSTKFVEMMIQGWPLIFLWQGQIWVQILLFRENVEKSFSQNVVKTSSWNLQCMIKVVKPFSYNQNIHKIVLSLNSFSETNSLINFHQISYGFFCQRDIDSLFKWFHIIEQDSSHAHIW